jgi:hypothetical protein
MLLWSREIADGQASGFASTEYLCDGTQRKIIDALVEALAEARGQLGRFSLQVVDVVSDVRLAATKINRDVPVSIARNLDTGRQSIEKPTVVSMLPPVAKAIEV